MAGTKARTGGGNGTSTRQRRGGGGAATATATKSRTTTATRTSTATTRPATQAEFYRQLAAGLTTWLRAKHGLAVEIRPAHAQQLWHDLVTGWIGRELHPRKGRGVAILPGLGRLRLTRKAATKAKQGRNPFTGAAMTVAAKPARNTVRFTAAKAFRESF